MGQWRLGAIGRRCGLLATLVAGSLAAPAQAGDAEWVQRALDGQYRLAHDVGFVNAPWVGTHNSFNSTAEMGQTLSAQDANQQIDIPAQLDAGIRSLELDVHRFPDIPGAAPRVCHARGHSQGHFGCTIEKPLTTVLGEIGTWLREREHSREVLLLYLEDHLDDEQGYGDGAAAIDSQLGELVYKPPPGGCTELPQDLTRRAMLDAGHQVVIVSDCGVGSAWPATVFNWNSHLEDRPVDYEDFPDCGPDFTREEYDSRLIRYYEDSTALTNQIGPPTGIATADDGITPETAAAMMRCGVDLTGLDQLSGPGDARLEALVWSWAPGEPDALPVAKRECVKQVVSGEHEHGRWFDAKCRVRRPAACRSADGTWSVTAQRVRQRQAKEECGALGAAYAAPRTGHEAQLLRLAMEDAEVGSVRIGLRLSATGSPRPLDAR